MNRNFQLLAAAVALSLCGAFSVTQARAMGTGPYQIPDDASIRPPGPEADPYLQHYHGRADARFADQYWVDLVSNGKNVEEVSLALPGPEADPYLEHYQGTGQYTGLPVKLAVGAYHLLDYEMINPAGKVQHPFGEDAVGYMLITPDHFASVSIAPADKVQAAQSFISYVGRLNFQGDRSIHPFVSHDPTWIGVDQVNSWDLTNGKLTLTSPVNPADGTISRFVWELAK
jgi:Lipocalin-like domain